jgi:hypothetical protein
VFSNPDSITHPAPGVIQVRNGFSGRMRRIATRDEVINYACEVDWKDDFGRSWSDYLIDEGGRIPRGLVASFHHAHRDAIYPF